VKTASTSSLFIIDAIDWHELTCADENPIKIAALKQQTLLNSA